MAKWSSLTAVAAPPMMPAAVVSRSCGKSRGCGAELSTLEVVAVAVTEAWVPLARAAITALSSHARGPKLVGIFR
eukprot:scaffold115381_cov31-Tisochrysis_lutea.AAC.5